MKSRKPYVTRLSGFLTRLLNITFCYKMLCFIKRSKALRQELTVWF